MRCVSTKIRHGGALLARLTILIASAAYADDPFPSPTHSRGRAAHPSGRPSRRTRAFSTCSFSGCCKAASGRSSTDRNGADWLTVRWGEAEPTEPDGAHFPTPVRQDIDFSRRSSWNH